MITKGSVQSILEICDQVEVASQALKPIANFRVDILTRLEALWEPRIQNTGRMLQRCDKRSRYYKGR